MPASFLSSGWWTCRSKRPTAQARSPQPYTPILPRHSHSASGSPNPGWGGVVGGSQLACCRAVGSIGCPHPPLPPHTHTAGDGCCTWARLPLPQSRPSTCSTPRQELESRAWPSGLGRVCRWQSPRGCSRHGHEHRVGTAVRKPHEDSFWPCALPQFPQRWMSHADVQKGDVPRGRNTPTQVTQATQAKACCIRENEGQHELPDDLGGGCPAFRFPPSDPAATLQFHSPEVLS